MFRYFWWGDGEGKKKMHNLKWKEFCKTIVDGGLGIRDAKSNNLALLGNTCWCLLRDDNLLCSKILEAKYCPKSNLWEAKYRKGNSWFWRGFVEGVSFIYDIVGWIIGNGEKISVWDHS